MRYSLKLLRTSLCLAVAAVLSAAPLSAAETDATDPLAGHPLNEWVKQSPRERLPSPSFSWEGSASWDPGGRQWIHFGGHDGVPQGFMLFTVDVPHGIWKQKFPNTSPPGVCCVDGSNIFDRANGRFIAFPGASLGHGWQFSRGVKLKRSHAWAYDPDTNEWTNMRPPPYAEPKKYARDILGTLNSGAAYDANHEVAISFGGQGAGGKMNSLWVYDVYANDAHNLRPENSPSPRDGMGVCYDEKNDCLVSFGSQYENDERTWIYRFETNRWEAHDLVPHPSGKKAKTYSSIPKMAYDSLHGICLCLVRLNGEGGRHETWALDVAKLEWTKLNPAAEPDPSKSRARNLDFAPELDAFILESLANERGNQIWTYRYAPRPTDPRPKPPTGLVAVTSNDRAVLDWKPDEGTKASRFRVYRAEAEHAWETKFEQIAETSAPTFEDTALERGRIYFYKVTALDADGRESDRSRQARTQPRVLGEPVASVLAADEIEITWPEHTATDIVGYNIYRGDVSVATVTKGSGGSWRDNDPQYAEPRVVKVRDITRITRLNEKPLTGTRFVDTQVDLGEKHDDVGDYRFAVKAYVIRSVNRLGTESGPSPYALTIPREPRHVLLREQRNEAEIVWEPAAEKEVAGYHVYKLGENGRMVQRITEELLTQPRFTHRPGHKTRYFITTVDKLGQEGQPSSPVWFGQAYFDFFEGEWHQ